MPKWFEDEYLSSCFSIFQSTKIKNLNKIFDIMSNNEA